MRLQQIGREVNLPEYEDEVEQIVADIVEQMYVKFSKELVFDIIDEVADEEAEKKVLRKYPEIKEVIKTANQNAPINFIDFELDDIADDEVEKVKRCHVPAERLIIDCNRKDINGEYIDNLLDERESGDDLATGKSKWTSNFESPGRTTLDITITVKDEYPPLTLTHYALKSADNLPEQDPSSWQLLPISVFDREGGQDEDFPSDNEILHE